MADLRKNADNIPLSDKTNFYKNTSKE